MLPVTVNALTSLKLEIHNKIKIETNEQKYGVYYKYDSWLTEEEEASDKYYKKEKITQIYPNSVVLKDGKKYTFYELTIKEGEYKEGETVEVKNFDIIDIIEQNPDFVFQKRKIISGDYCWGYLWRKEDNIHSIPKEDELLEIENKKTKKALPNQKFKMPNKNIEFSPYDEDIAEGFLG